MKKLFIIFLMFFSIGLNKKIFSESTASDSTAVDSLAIVNTVSKDSLNISELVSAQIKAAREKEKLKAEKQVVNVKTEKTLNLSLFFSKGYLKKFVSVFDGVNLNIVILIGAALLLGTAVFIRRKTANAKSKATGDFKKNVLLIREEKALRIRNKKAKDIRNKLIKKLSYPSTDENILTKKAKDLKVSKGELLLAARIKSFELERRKK